MKTLSLTVATLLFSVQASLACDVALQVSKAWVQPTQKDVPAPIYFDLKNIGDDALTLTAVSSPSGTVEIAGAKDGAITIGAGQTVSLTPKTAHLVLTQAKKPLKVGDNVKLSLYFSEDDVINIALPVSDKPSTDIVEPMHHQDDDHHHDHK